MDQRCSPSPPVAVLPRQRPGQASGGEDSRSEDVLARARTSFLTDDAVPPGVVRKEILASWSRSRSWHVRPDQLELGSERGPDRDSLLRRAADPVLRNVEDLLSTEPVSVILCDADGVVLTRWTGDPALEQYLNSVWLAPGFSYSEQAVGTNGIGTALEARGPAEVFGHEHYASRLEVLACAGVPVHDPVSGKVLGVVDLTCWQRDSGPLLRVTAGTLARRVERTLMDYSGPRELAVLSDYLTACRRNRGPVLAIGDDLLMMNDLARLLLDPADTEPLLAQAGEALASRRRHPLLVDLPSGRTARVYCRPTVGPDGVVGGVLDVQLMSPPAERSSPSLPPPVSASLAVGSSAAWRKCCLAADRHLQAGEWLVVEGEPGSGRETVARAAHQGRTPVGRLRVLRAEDHGPGWVDEVADELAAGAGTIILTDVDQLPGEVAAELAEVLEEQRESTDVERPWVVVTLGADTVERTRDLALLLQCFPATVDVPPLRRHVEDLPELVPHLLTRLARGSALSCSPEVMRLFARSRWPGNVDQLVSVLRRVVAKRRTGVIELRDLPAECWAVGRRRLSPLESLECDAIVQALLDARGDKAEAARRLAMSRATIYRRIKGYGILLPSAVQVGEG